MNIALLHYGYSSVGCTGTGKEIAFLTTIDRYQTTEEAEEADIECTGLVWGMKLVSAYLLLNSISVVFSLIVTPIFGSFIDFSPNRKFWTIFTASIYVSINGIQIFANEQNWLIMVLLALFIQSVAYQAHKACVGAYCTEVAEGEEEVVALQSAGRVWELVTMLSALVIIGGLGVVAGNDVGRTAMIGQIVATAYCVPFTFLSYKRLEERPALHKDDGNKEWSKGFKQLWNTTKLLYSTNYMVLQYL